MFKSLSNLASMLKQAQQMSGKMQEINERLKSERATASTGAGLVEVEVNGLGEVLRVKIDPALVARGEREMIEDLLPGAVNQAVTKARKLHMEAMKSLTEGFNLPGLDQAIDSLNIPPDESGSP